MYLLDTNVVSALRRPERAAPGLRAWAAGTEAQQMYLSVVTLYEIELGIRQVDRRDQAQGAMLTDWFRRKVVAGFRGRILPIDDRVAIRCAALQIPDPKPERDAFIAATALVHDLTIVTRNSQDFTGTGVRLLDSWR